MPSRRITTRPCGVGLVLTIAVVLTATGCVRRRLTVRSNPPGALVHVDNQRIGTTPCSVDYVYYGTREIRLSAPGYETLTVNQPLPAPWYELPGIDFISENLVPARIEDARTVSFNLQRQRLMAPEEVIARGEELRRQVTPLGAAPVIPASAAAPLTPTPASGFDAFGPGAAPSPTPAFTTPAFNPPATRPPVEPSVPVPQAPGLPDTFRY